MWLTEDRLERALVELVQIVGVVVGAAQRVHATPQGVAHLGDHVSEGGLEA